MIQLMLVKEGYAVLAASDGQEALEILEKFAAPIHLVVTDGACHALMGGLVR